MGGNNSKKAKKETSPPQSVKNVQAVKTNNELGETLTVQNVKRKSSVMEKEDDGKFSTSKISKLYDRYKDSDDVISMQGIVKFCTDLNVDAESGIILVLAWHMKAKTMGIFTKEEFVLGLTELQADTLDKLKDKFVMMEKELADQTKFKEIFKFAFHFAKDSTQKNLSIDMAKELLKLLMGDRFPHSKTFVAFLAQSQYKVMNFDQWQNFLEFNKAIAVDLHNYDEGSAWPVMFDDYVQYVRGSKAG